MDILNETLQSYGDVIDAGFARVEPHAFWLFGILTTITIASSAFIWALTQERVIPELVKKVLFIGIMGWLIGNWQEITTNIASSFMILGATAGGGVVLEGVLQNPTDIAQQGLDIARLLLHSIRDLTGQTSFFFSFSGELFVLLGALVIIFGAYVALAIQLLVAILAIKIGSLATLILLPFGLTKQTSFISERPLGWVFASGIRLMLLTLVVGLGQSVLLKTAAIPAGQITVLAAARLMVHAIILLVMAYMASRIASDLATATARLGAFDALVSLVATGAAINYSARVAHRSFTTLQNTASVRAATSVNNVKPSYIRG